MTHAVVASALRRHGIIERSALHQVPTGLPSGCGVVGAVAPWPSAAWCKSLGLPARCARRAGGTRARAGGKRLSHRAPPRGGNFRLKRLGIAARAPRIPVNGRLLQQNGPLVPLRQAPRRARCGRAGHDDDAARGCPHALRRPSDRVAGLPQQRGRKVDGPHAAVLPGLGSQMRDRPLEGDLLPRRVALPVERVAVCTGIAKQTLMKQNKRYKRVSHPVLAPSSATHHRKRRLRPSPFVCRPLPPCVAGPASF